MRQESRFDREAASPAAARGLMQLTLPAAGEAARELNESPPAYADLYDPARSLRLGARTLKNLLAALRRGRRARGLGLQRRAPARPRSGRRGARRPVEALLASISYVGDAHVRPPRPREPDPLPDVGAARAAAPVTAGR